MAHSVKHLTLDPGSGHALTVREFEPPLGSVLMAWNLPGLLSVLLSAPPLLVLSLSKINKST